MYLEQNYLLDLAINVDLDKSQQVDYNLTCPQLGWDHNKPFEMNPSYWVHFKRLVVISVLLCPKVLYR